MRYLSASSLLLLLALVGCTDYSSIPPPAVIEVTGKALLPNGQPINSGKINFSPPEGSTAGAEAYSDIKSDGSFKLQSFGGRDGVLPGTYKVSVRTTNNTAMAGIDPKFFSGTSSTITITIKPETRDVGSIKFQ